MNKLLFFIMFCFSVFCAKAQMLIDYKQTANELVEQVLLKPNSGIKIKTVRYVGHKKSIARFVTNAKSMPVKYGIVLCNGEAEQINGPNEVGGNGEAISFLDNNTNVFKNYATGRTWDECVLEIDFYANTSEICFDYVFGSEEYPEYVNKGVNDIFVFLIGKTKSKQFKNIALVPNTKLPVSVDNINKYTNNEYFIENGNWNNYKKGNFKGTPQQLELAYTCQYDGFTTLLTAKSEVEPYTLYTLKLAMADVGDNLYDSGVMLRGKSMISNGDSIPLADLIKRDLGIINSDTNIFTYNQQNNSINLVINFDFDSDKVKQEYHNALKKMSKLIQQYFDRKVYIIGHTDDIGSNVYNQTLSERRAKAVYDFLLQQKVNKKQINFKGKGSSEPIQGNHSDTKNRRVEFVFY